MSQLSELGRTRLYTRRERRRRLAALALALLGAAAAAWVAAALVGTLSGADTTWPTVKFRPLFTSSSATSGNDGGGLLGLPYTDPQAPRTDQPLDAISGQSQGRPQFPVTLAWPAPLGWILAAALPLWLVWLRYIVSPILAGLRRLTRHRGLAPLPAIRRALGVGTVRRAGRYTLPGTSWWTRLTLPTTAFGYRLGHPLHQHSTWRRRWLWADWEQRIRIVARTGWGKTDRLLIPIIRALPGPALVASIEPAIFEKTVTARHHRRTALRWPWLTRLPGRGLPITTFPVAVIDFTAPDRRYAAGYPQVRWLPIIDCADYAIAYRRAAALITGADTAAVTSTENGQFFRDSATEVLAAWLHAADLADKDIDDLLAWLRHPDDPTPTRILRDDPRAEPSAAVNLTRHLDAAAGRTTSGVLRYLTLGLNSLATREGRQLCGRRGDEQFDMERLITDGGTVYLLADTGRIDRTKPLLSLFAAEMFFAAESVALRTRRRRLRRPFVAVVDELRYGVTIPNLPYVASSQRKYGIGYVYGVQATSQEDAVYGPDAPALRAAAGVTIIGGIDIDSARELTDRAGTVPVVTPTHGQSQHSEQIQLQDVLTVADQQQLADGHAVILARGLAPFLAWVPSIRDSRSLNKTITHEADAVAQQVAAARERDLATARLDSTTTETGIDFTTDGVR